MTDIVYLNGAYLPKVEARLSPDDRGFLFADGIYEVIRSYRGHLYAADEHFARLADGLAATRIAGVDVAGLREVVGTVLARNGLAEAEATVYLQVTRGVAPRIHAFPQPAPAPTVYVAAQAFKPKYDPAQGLAAITEPDVRWARCDIKSVALLPNVLANQRAHEAGAQEAIFVRDGVALEGTHTSFFGVVGGVVRTAPCSNYILPSITRAAVLSLCRAHGIPCAEAPIFVHQLGEADELFLAGTTMEIMPVVTLDGRPVGSGRPGPVAAKLLALFRESAGARG